MWNSCFFENYSIFQQEEKYTEEKRTKIKIKQEHTYDTHGISNTKSQGFSVMYFVEQKCSTTFQEYRLKMNSKGTRKENWNTSKKSSSKPKSNIIFNINVLNLVFYFFFL